MINGALVGAGGVLAGATLGSRAEASAPPAIVATIPRTLDKSWTGPGGIGDYAAANGNTYVTVNAAHAVRDGAIDVSKLPPVTEVYDAVIVGSGISGLCAAYELRKARPAARILMIDNNGIFGGEAKENEVEVDGYRLQAPQGSNMCVWPAKAAEKLDFFWHKAWREIGMPMGDEPGGPVWLSPPDMTLPKNHYSAMMVVRDRWPQAHFFPDPKQPGQMRHAVSPWRNGYRDLPFPEAAKQELTKLDGYKLTKPANVDAIEPWLDSMTYKQFLTDVVGVKHKEVFDYLSPEIASYGTGMGCETVSALAARDYRAPGTSTAEEDAVIDAHRAQADTAFEPISFPGGNTTIARYFVKRLVPDALAGDDTLKDITYGRVDWAALDRPGAKVRIRTGCTAIDVRHDGTPDDSKSVLVTYVENASAKEHRVRAKAVIMATGQWINKYIARDAPEDTRTAMDAFNHAPMLIVNVAVRNWQFIHALGTPAVRWYEGIGWFTNVRAPMSLDGYHMPVDPSKPAVLTFYIPYSTYADIDFDNLPVRGQCITARTALFSMTFDDIEARIRKQLAASFGPYGFDDKRDIAAIIANRWGHAYVVPEVNFFHGKDGKPSPRDVVRKGYGRIRFGHSELSGVQVWHHACDEGERAAKQVMEFV